MAIAVSSPSLNRALRGPHLVGFLPKRLKRKRSATIIVRSALEGGNWQDIARSPAFWAAATEDRSRSGISATRPCYNHLIAARPKSSTTGPFIAGRHPLLRYFCVQKQFIVVWSSCFRRLRARSGITV